MCACVLVLTLTMGSFFLIDVNLIGSNNGRKNNNKKPNATSTRDQLTFCQRFFVEDSFCGTKQPVSHDYIILNQCWQIVKEFATIFYIIHFYLCWLWFSKWILIKLSIHLGAVFDSIDKNTTEYSDKIDLNERIIYLHIYWHLMEHSHKLLQPDIRLKTPDEQL